MLQQVVGATHTKEVYLSYRILCHATTMAMQQDHFAFCAHLQVPKPPKERKTVTFRRMKQLGFEKFKCDPDSSSLLFDTNDSLEDM